jgi:hypothetical protein
MSKREGEAMNNNSILYPLVGIGILLLGLLDFITSGLIMNQSPLTFSSSSVTLFIFVSNLKFAAMLIVGIGLLKRKLVARWAAIGTSLVCASFLAIWLQQNAMVLQEMFAWGFYLYSFIILPALLIIPVALVAPSIARVIRSRAAEPEGVFIPSPEVTPAEPNL